MRRREFLPLLAFAPALLGSSPVFGERGAPGTSLAAPDSTAMAADSSATLSQDPIRREIEAAYARMAAAYEEKDAEAFMADMTLDFKAKSKRGRVADRYDAEAGIRRRLDRSKSVEDFVIRIREFAVNGDSALAVTSQDVSRVVVDAEGKEHAAVTRDVRTRDTWTRTGASWKLARIEEIDPGEETLDGEPVERRKP